MGPSGARLLGTQLCPQYHTVCQASRMRHLRSSLQCGSGHITWSHWVCSVGLPWWLRWLRIWLQCRRPEFNSLTQKDPLENGMATHSSILAGEMPWTEESGSYSPWGHKELYTTEQLTLSLYLQNVVTENHPSALDQSKNLQVALGSNLPLLLPP